MVLWLIVFHFVWMILLVFFAVGCSNGPDCGSSRGGGIGCSCGSSYGTGCGDSCSGGTNCSQGSECGNGGVIGCGSGSGCGCGSVLDCVIVDGIGATGCSLIDKQGLIKHLFCNVT